jgi:prepilin-type N-terminal cleavage/methylation domain-containing protein
MNLKTTNKSHGFTIVELLIVIVVIGILAAITIVAYNGVQSRARATTYQTDAASLVKKIEAYGAASASNNYPLTAAGSDAATVTAQTTAGASFVTTMNSVNESKLAPNIAIFAVVAYAASPVTYAQTLTAVNASSTVDQYFVAWCPTGKGIRVYYPDPVNSAVKTADAGVCP